MDSQSEGEDGNRRMENVLFIIAASGLCAVTSGVNGRYQVVYELKTWTEALSYCRENYTDLATIESMEDVTTLKHTVDLSKMTVMKYNYRVWVGLYDDVNSWRWSASDFIKNIKAELRNWFSGQPDNQGSIEYCVTMLDGLWYDDPCMKLFRAVCSDDTGTFIYISNLMSWTEAQSYCRAHYTDLASVSNMTENQKLTQLVPAGVKVWIGLFRDSWKWTDGSNSSFRYWTAIEPNNLMGNEVCVAANMEEYGKMEDWGCDWKKEFVCYIAPVYKQVVKVKLIKTCSLDLTDPAVMEAMLNQMKQKLKDQGVKGDIKLSWRKQPDEAVFQKDEKETQRSIN